ncbi:hypothetical protein P0W64_21200 [Tsukamurella sp. 8F]|uniref:hypothetical protein n=1 Tax=unclassified Tsukamurella TaxID=2633480 RepID=UPI0023B8F7D4|nr:MULTISPECIES: hypothetical protein [unclassified Tsukamurella]MDF0532275.1 hypothetical protein [Tsukamurella sp. 8J]MDF0589301.1 hypothetical protein [Tsukamurella sp. 8F]
MSEHFEDFVARGVAAQVAADRAIGLAVPDAEDEVNQIKAFRDTLALAEERGMDEDPDSDVGLAHLRGMLATVEQTADSFSPAKLGRWLGWVQSAVVAAKVGTLDDMRAINNRNKAG